MKASLSGRQLVSAAAGLLVCAGTAHASGFRIPEASLAGLGTSNALVANDQELGALAYNPAAMSVHDGTNLAGGLLVIDPNLSVTTQTGKHDSDPDSPFYVPNFFVMSHINPDITWGINVNVPFGLETNWADETFPAFAGPIDALEPSRSRIEMVNLNPNFAFRLPTGTSLAVGVDYYDVMDATLDSQGIKMSGDGAGWGWNIGALHKAGQWGFGLSYRSSVQVDIDGTFDATRIGSTSSAAATQIEFPDMLQVGVRLQATDALGVEFDYERTGWSSFDNIAIRHSSPGVTNPVVSTNNWEDSNTYRLGFTWQVASKTQLRFGYSYDETPQPDARFSARIPDADRQLLSIGVKQDIAGWNLEAGYMYVMFDDRTYNSSVPFGTYGTDPNGTSAYNGTYEANVQLLGIGVTKKF